MKIDVNQSFIDLIKPSTVIAGGIGSIAASYLEKFYGGDRLEIILLLCLVIAMDWLSGIAAARKEKNYSSSYGINGVFRTIVMLILPAVASLLDSSLSTSGVIFYGVTIGLIFHTFNSFNANSIRAGWSKWMPTKMIKFLENEVEAKRKRYTKKEEEK
jgi:toxin secretion/phage lysis holin